MAKGITYKNLYTLVANEIENRQSYNTKSGYRSQQAREAIAPLSFSSTAGTADVSVSQLVTAVQNLLIASLPSRIISGLAVSATDPVSDSVTISAGSGTAAGVLYNLDEDITIQVPLNLYEVVYICLYKDRIVFEKNESTEKLTIAKIIVPKVNVSAYIKETKDDSFNAYIVNLRTVDLYEDAYGNFEEDTIERFRDAIGDILADNLIGNIRLSENLKIINTTGSVELDSSSLKIKDADENVLAKFNKNGVFLYDYTGVELAKFTGTEARIGNIKIVKNALQSGNFISGLSGFQLKDDGNVEFNNLLVRGTVYATSGEIGGWTIADNMLYGTTTGIIQTGAQVGTGYNGVKLSVDGLEVFDDVLGRVAYFPSDGSAPSISSGTITEVVYEISTNAVIRTSDTVGDGSANSNGILINNTGLYGCEENQTLSNANLKALADGTIRLQGTIYATYGELGSVTITPDKLSGGLIEGATIRGSVIENSATLPKIVIDSTGIYYSSTTNIGKYGESGSGLYGFKYGDGTLYGGGLRAILFGTDLPPITILSEDLFADMRFYNRASFPSEGTYEKGDIICVDGKLAQWEETNSEFVQIGALLETRTDDPTNPQTGRIWFRSDLV